MPSEDQLLLLIEKDRQKSPQISPEIGASAKCKETCVILVILFSNMVGLVVDMMPLTFFTYEAKKRGLLEYQTGIVIGCYDFGRLISGPLCASMVSIMVAS